MVTIDQYREKLACTIVKAVLLEIGHSQPNRAFWAFEININNNGTNFVDAELV